MSWFKVNWYRIGKFDALICAILWLCREGLAWSLLPRHSRLRLDHHDHGWLQPLLRASDTAGSSLCRELRPRLDPVSAESFDHGWIQSLPRSLAWDFEHMDTLLTFPYYSDCWAMNSNNNKITTFYTNIHNNFFITTKITFFLSPWCFPLLWCPLASMPKSSLLGLILTRHQWTMDMKYSIRFPIGDVTFSVNFGLVVLIGIHAQTYICALNPDNRYLYGRLHLKKFSSDLISSSKFTAPRNTWISMETAESWYNAWNYRCWCWYMIRFCCWDNQDLRNTYFNNILHLVTSGDLNIDLTQKFSVNIVVLETEL